MLSMLKNVADAFTPVLTQSHFSEKGVLTPEEFVLAGDQLVFSCPTWQWGTVPKGTAKSYLPEGKQYLITRNVPSLRRAHTYALADAKEEVIKSEGAGDMQDGEGWLSTHSQADMAKNRQVYDMDDDPCGPDAIAKPAASAASSAVAAAAPSAAKAAAPAAAAVASKPAAAPAAAHDDDEVGDIDDLDADMSHLVVAKPGAAAGAASSGKPAAAAPAEEEFPDMEAFDDDENVLPPPTQHSAASAASAPAAASSSSSSAAASASNAKGAKGAKQPLPVLKAEEPEDNIVKTRTYDISIVYDKYYRTPRVYLFGYDEHRQPLTPEQIMEDISADHANKTVTVESHPYLGVAHASIHPCKHAHVMKRIVDQMSSYQSSEGSHGSAKQVDVKQYMYIFLKFISSVIPTIEYDFTS